MSLPARLTSLSLVFAVSLWAPVAAAPAFVQEEDEGELMPFDVGEVSIGGELATASLPEGWSYYQTEEARFIVEDYWGNPPDESVIGLVTPGDDVDWAIIVSYEEDGYVDDSDIASIDFDDLLDDMQRDAKSYNEQRREEGYPTVDLLGWAEEPHYDSAAKKLYWAKELQFEDEEAATLNYNVRILGRRGVLVLNAVAQVDELEEVAAGSKELLAVTRFNEGHRYEDYVEGVDKIAAYGIGGLIAGKVAAKVGLLKAVGLFLAKGWKLILIGVAVLGGFLKKLVGGGKTQDEEEELPAE